MHETIRLTGQTRFERNGDQELLHRVETTIAPGRVQTALTGYGDGCATHPPITSTDPAVERWEREKDRVAQVTAYRNRPITTRFKTPKRRRQRQHPDAVPSEQ